MNAGEHVMRGSWLLLAVGIALEVAGTVCLGNNRTLP
jgi:hypothetical protein